MADYKELLRRAVEALPENNGAARRAVYEKARAALVGQLRAINPPLAARDITAHRLQLEDCIRQVEQEASEAVIASLGAGETITPPQVPVYFDEPPQAKTQPPVAAKPQPPAPRPVAKAPPAAKAQPAAKEPPKPLPVGGTIEEIIAAANAEHPEPAQEAKTRTLVRPEAKPMGKPVPKLVPAARPHLVAAAEAKPEPVQAPPPPPAPEPEEEPVPEAIQALVEPIEEVVPEVEEKPDPEVLPVAASNKRANGRPLPSIVARAEAAKSRTSSAAFGAPIARPFDGPRRSPVIEPRRESAAPRLEPAARGGQQAVARQQVAEPIALFEEPQVGTAMSAVREVEVEAQPADPQGAIDRAIATLDRAIAEVDTKASGNAVEIEDAIDVEPDEPAPPQKRGSAPVGRIKIDGPAVGTPPQRNARPAKVRAKPAARRGGRRDPLEVPLPRHDEDEEPRSGISAVTIFLIVFVLLLVGAGGAGFWAWREGFIDLDAMFGHGTPAVQQQAAAVTAPAANSAATADTPATGPGNTDTSSTADAAAPTAELQQNDRLTNSQLPAAPTAQAALPLVETQTASVATPDRLGSDAQPGQDQAAAVAALDPANLAGSQSLLLEASDNGTTGAVPFSGTVEWSKGTDEMGLPTLVAKANIPARNLSVDVLIRKNSDPSLPASHLMEINFHVNDAFIGGSVAGLPGVLLKDQELVQGTPLVGASARVVGNSFLFALSASPDDIKTNTDLLLSRKWMDLAVIYATGKRAIITLEKDDAAQKLFADVGQAWTKAASN